MRVEVNQKIKFYYPFLRKTIPPPPEKKLLKIE